MNVAIFASAFHPHLGGVEEHCRQVGRELIRRGHGVVVLTNRWPRNSSRHSLVDGIPVYRLAFRVPEGGAKAQLTYRLTHRAIRREVDSILLRHAVDVLHVHCVSANALYARLAKASLGLPLIVTAHGEVTMDAARVFQRSALMNQVLRDAVDAADAVTACSSSTLRDLAAHLGGPIAAPSSVVYNGISPEEFAGAAPFAHSRPFVLGIGRLVHQKGFDLLLRAYASLPSPAVDLLIAGDGAEAASLRALAAELGIADRVRFAGRADRPTVASLFAGCAFFVLPSREEPMGIVNLEAMLAGKAVVASRVGGVPEVVVDGETGVLVEPGSPPALADAMRALLADAALASRLGAAGRERARRFTWAETTRQYLDLYEPLARRPARIA